MKQIKRKLIAALTAVTAAAASVIPASAQPMYLSRDDKTDIRLEKTISLNYPYLNITLDKGGINTSGMTFTIKKDGKAVAVIDGSGTKLTVTDKSLGMYDITNVSNDKDLQALCGKENITRMVPFSSVCSVVPTSIYTEGLYTDQDIFPDVDLKLGPNDTVYYRYIDPSKVSITGTRTVPANTAIVSVSGRYAGRGNDPHYVTITAKSTDKIYLTPKAGETVLSSVSAGEYAQLINGSGNPIYDRSVVVHNTPKEYVKLRFPAEYMADVIKYNGDYCIKTYDYNNGQEKALYATIGKISEGQPYTAYVFRSHSIVTADIPDENGYIEVWALKDDLESISFHKSFSQGSIGGSWNNGFKWPFIYRKVQLSMPYPKTGVTLYKIPSGKYTVEVSDSAYQLSGNTLNVTGKSELQKMALKLSKKPSSPTVTTKATTTSAAKDTTAAAATTTSAATTTPADTVSAADSSVPEEESSSLAEDTSSEDESSSESEADTVTVTTTTTTAAVSSSDPTADDSVSAGTESSVSAAENEDSSSDTLRMILIIGGGVLVIVIIAVFIIKKIIRDRIDNNN